MKVELIEDSRAYDGFLRLRRMRLRHERYDGGTTPELRREVIEQEDVAAALLVDPRRSKVVLVEQFRVGPYAASESPWLIDIVAGRIVPGDDPATTIAREITEETGLECGRPELIGRYYTAPHFARERVWLYYAEVDSSRVEGLHGIADEGEDIRPRVLELNAALALPAKQTLSLWAALALEWLARRQP